MRIAITNGRVIKPSRLLENSAVIVEDDKIIDVIAANKLDNFDGRIIDAGNRYISPGFVDIHTHGAGGADYMDGSVDAICTAAKMHMRHGATCVLPTTLTSGESELYDSLEMFRQAKTSLKDGPELLGIHLEGPYFAYSQKGAQDPRYLKDPSGKDYIEILKRGGDLIKRWSLAPELPGALEMGRMLKERGIVCSAGHTDATYEQMLDASENGFTHITHLYSGMSSIKRIGGFRYAGALEAGFLIDSMSVEIIADGKHLPSSLLTFVCKFKPHDKICLITDSMRAAGMKDGEYILGSVKDGMRVIVEDDVAKLPDRTAFAGSVATPDRLIRTMIRMTDLTVVKAVQMLTANPCAVMGIADQKGSLQIGKDADIVIFDDDINISFVMVNGDIKINDLVRK